MLEFFANAIRHVIVKFFIFHHKYAIYSYFFILMEMTVFKAAHALQPSRPRFCVVVVVVVVVVV